jgi:hypothetical protein
MEELNQRFAIATINQELKLLADTFQYDAVGMNFLIELLNHSKLEIRAKAYHLLQNIDSEKVRQARSKGILLNPGDRVYIVYRTPTFFTDSSYILESEENRILELNINYDYKSNGYKITKEDNGLHDNGLHIVAKPHHYFSKYEAELIAESLHQEIMQEWSFMCFNIHFGDDDNFNAKQWCLENNLSGKWNNRDEIKDFLEKTDNLNLLSKLWKETEGNFATICEIHIGKKSYLTIDKNLPDITTPEQRIKQLDSYYKEDPDHYEDYGYKESDISLLIESLNNPEIKVRATAYKLLQNALKTKKVQLAIAQGLLLNPGDRVYSVWKAEIGFDDEAYYLIDSCGDLERELIIKEISVFDDNNYYELDDDYSEQDYPEEEYEVSEDDYQDPEIESYNSFVAEYIEQNESIKISDRVCEASLKDLAYLKGNRQTKIWDELANLDLEISDSYERGCLFVSRHICKNQAEGIAESLHQKMMKKYSIGSFRWDKINDLETWCIANNVPYQKKYYGDSNKDSSISGIDEKHLMNYLQQPKNIDLLSKLWKDAVGRFAFVCEQTVKNKTYLKIDVNYQC